MRAASRSRLPGVRCKRQRQAIFLISIAAGLLIREAAGPPWTTLRFTGLLVMIVSLALVFVARVQLGAASRVTARAEMLVTTGLYSRVRHPIYMFGTLAIAGYALWSRRGWVALALVVIVPLQWVRARRETQVLRARFGEAYETWQRRCWS